MTTSHKPPHQRPECPDFWDQRFQTGVMPWDAGGVPLELRRFAERQSEPVATLIPGCGQAWEAGYLSSLGWPVTAIDFSEAAIEKARLQLQGRAAQLRCADFFEFESDRPPALIYERAFLCALPRRLWPAWAARLAACLPSGAHVAGYFFFSQTPKGPPFGLAPGELHDLIGADFVQLEDEPAQASLPVFSGGERWQVWQKR